MIVEESDLVTEESQNLRHSEVGRSHHCARHFTAKYLQIRIYNCIFVCMYVHDDVIITVIISRSNELITALSFLSVIEINIKYCSNKFKLFSSLYS